VVVIGLAVLVNGLELGRTTSDEAWTKLERAKTPSERVELARDYPNTEPERWALLRAATEYYNQGFADLPANRDVALPILKKALDLFARVARESPPDAPQARVAALGLAQTLEARNKIDKAIAQYERVIKTWKGSDEARQAEAKIQALSKPENLAFYQELYAYKPPEVTLPPGGRSSIPLPPDRPPIGGPSMLPPPVTVPPPPRPAPKPEAAPPSGEMPDDILAPEPEASAPEVEATKETEGRGTDSPGDILAPESKPEAPKS
ncbi:MAG TPA: tetratricopeptide repeat protein, partial [Isosphaeraceae bacterium]|nr:tetratricopeptide repeat protein [Isosphaeraceae bacterium]